MAVYTKSCKNEINIAYRYLQLYPEYNNLIEQVCVCVRENSCDMKVWNDTNYIRVANLANWFFEWTIKPIVDPLDGEKIKQDDYFFYYYNVINDDNIREYYNDKILWWFKATYYDKIPTSPHNENFMFRPEKRQRDIIVSKEMCKYLHIKGYDGTLVPVPLVVQFVLDYSGSMTSQAHSIENMEQSVKNYIECTNGVHTCRTDIDEVGCIKFTLNKMLSVTTDDNKLSHMFDTEVGFKSLNTGDYTSSGFKNCLLIAINDIVNNGNSNGNRVIVAMTDGQNPYLTDVIAYAKANNVKINFIGFGPAITDSSRTVMKKVATDTGGIYRDAPTVDDMATAFDYCLSSSTELQPAPYIDIALTDSEIMPSSFTRYSLNSHIDDLTLLKSEIDIDSTSFEMPSNLKEITGYSSSVVSETDLTFTCSFSKKSGTQYKVSDGNYLVTFSSSSKSVTVKLCISYDVTEIEEYWVQVRIESNCGCGNCCAVCCRGKIQEGNIPQKIIDYYTTYYKTLLRTSGRKSIKV